MIRRFFAYGCSYTNWDYPTWADFIGVNFDRYYNRGRGGCDHNFMLDRLHEDYIKYKFNPETDVIYICSTGFNRMSWYNNGYEWTVGDLYNWKNSIKQADLLDSTQLDGFFNLMWNLDWACRRSVNAVIQMKNFLDLTKVKYKIFQGMDNNFYIEKYLGLDRDTIGRLNQYFDIVDKFSLDAFRSKTEMHARDEENGVDGHPGLPRHFDFVKTYFPEYCTEKSQQLYDETFEPVFCKVHPSRKDRRRAYDNVLRNYPCMHYA